MKKLNKLVLRSWIGPFMVAFSVILFILVLQFLSKYIEDIAGKDIGMDVLGKVFLYSCLTLVPLALPLAVLLSSLLTMGNLGERYELAAMKSSGIGLMKIMFPLTQATFLITVSSLLFSFYVMPIANLKLYTLLYDLSNMKPTFALKEDHFYSGIDGLVIHVDEIDRETDMLYGIKIFDHTNTVGNQRITIADRGMMIPSKDQGYMRMTLFDGVMHEADANEPGTRKKEPYQRFYFDTLKYEVALTNFNLEQTNENTFVSHQYMLDIHELHVALDSLGKRNQKNAVDLSEYMAKYVHVDTTMTQEMKEILAKDTATYGPDGRITPDTSEFVVFWFPDLSPAELVNKAEQQARAVHNYATIVEERVDREAEKIRKFQIEVHQRWMLPTSCLVFLFLGAPLGAIIRKGGIGMPVLASIIFFILFYILMIQGRKLARDDIMEVWVGVWLPVLVMFPMAISFSYQSQTDSPILQRHTWDRIMKFLFGWLRFRKKKVPERQTMSVEELIALRERQKRDARQAIENHQKDKQ